MSSSSSAVVVRAYLADNPKNVRRLVVDSLQQLKSDLSKVFQIDDISQLLIEYQDTENEYLPIEIPSEFVGAASYYSSNKLKELVVRLTLKTLDLNKCEDDEEEEVEEEVAPETKAVAPTNVVKTEQATTGGVSLLLYNQMRVRTLLPFDIHFKEYSQKELSARVIDVSVASNKLELLAEYPVDSGYCYTVSVLVWFFYTVLRGAHGKLPNLKKRLSEWQAITYYARDGNQYKLGDAFLPAVIAGKQKINKQILPAGQRQDPADYTPPKCTLCTTFEDKLDLLRKKGLLPKHGQWNVKKREVIILSDDESTPEPDVKKPRVEATPSTATSSSVSAPVNIPLAFDSEVLTKLRSILQAPSLAQPIFATPAASSSTLANSQKLLFVAQAVSTSPLCKLQAYCWSSHYFAMSLKAKHWPTTIRLIPSEFKTFANPAQMHDLAKNQQLVATQAVWSPLFSLANSTKMQEFDKIVDVMKTKKYCLVFSTPGSADCLIIFPVVSMYNIQTNNFTSFVVPRAHLQLKDV